MTERLTEAKKHATPLPGETRVLREVFEKGLIRNLLGELTVRAHDKSATNNGQFIDLLQAEYEAQQYGYTALASVIGRTAHFARHAGLRSPAYVAVDLISTSQRIAPSRMPHHSKAVVMILPLQDTVLLRTGGVHLHNIHLLGRSDVATPGDIFYMNGMATGPGSRKPLTSVEEATSFAQLHFIQGE